MNIPLNFSAGGVVRATVTSGDLKHQANALKQSLENFLKGIDELEKQTKELSEMQNHIGAPAIFATASRPEPVEFEMVVESSGQLRRGIVYSNDLKPFIGKRVKVVVSLIDPTDTRQGE